jgi:hypothetical protein
MPKPTYINAIVSLYPSYKYVIQQRARNSHPITLEIESLRHAAVGSRLGWGRGASPANISAPRDRVELKVVDLELTSLRVGLDVVNALDGIDAGPKLWDVPAPRDLGAIMEDV